MKSRCLSGRPLRDLCQLAIVLYLSGGSLSAAAMPTPVQRAISAVQPAGGWAVCVGTTDGATEISLAEDDRWVVTGLAYDRAAGEKARKAAAEAGVAGRAAFHDVIDTSRLPIVDSSVALLVVDADALAERLPTEDEVRRVLRPGGIAVILRGDVGETVSKSRPGDIDDWTHFNYDATASDASEDQLAGPIRSLRWLGGDPFQDDIIGMRFSNGVLVAVEQNVSGRTGIHPPTGAIVARDAFSGAVLWRRDGFFVRSRYAFTLDDQRVYIHAQDARHFKKPADWKDGFLPNERPLVALDLFTGKDVRDYDQGLVLRTSPMDRVRAPLQEQAEQMTALIHRGKIIQRAGGSVAVLEPATGERVWRHDPPDGERVGMIAADGDRVIGMVGPEFSRAKMGYLQRTPIFKARAIVGWDLGSGRQLFRIEPKALSESPHTIRVAVRDGHIGVISYANYRNVHLEYTLSCYRASDGEELWAKNGPRKVMGGGHYARPQIHGGRLWSSGASGAIGWKLADGTDPVERVATNFRCSTARATPNWLISSQKFTSIESGESFFTEATRGRCDFGMFPANGMVYNSLGKQCGCAAFVRQRVALASKRPPAEPWSGQRLLPGDAGADQSSNWELPADDWPRMLKDARHSAWTDAKLAAEPAEAWTVDLSDADADKGDQVWQEWATHVDIPGPVTPATIFGDTVLVALTHQQAVVALDPKTGRERWRTCIDGRIDSPPVQVNETAFVGTRTGWVYAIDRASGKVRWRFLAAPHQQLIPASGQAESAWPLAGSLLIHDGLVWAAAGHQAELDHGIFWYGLDPATGKVMHSGRVAELAESHKDFWAERTRAKNTILTTDGKHLVLWRSGVDPKTGKQTRFGSTVKSYGPGVDRMERDRAHTKSARPGMRFLPVPLSSVRWGWSRVDKGMSYGGALGSLICFHDNEVYAIKERNGQMSLQRVEIDGWEVPAKVHLGGPQAFKREPTWQFSLRHVDLRRHNQPVSALVRTGNSVLVASCRGIFRIPFDGPADGEQPEPAIDAPVLVPHGISVAGSQMILTSLDGRVIAME